jgi:hypothetical protein
MKLQHRKKLFTTHSTVNELSMEVPIVAANKLVQHGMAIVSGEVIKECTISAVTTLTRNIPKNIGK